MFISIYFGLITKGQYNEIMWIFKPLEKHTERKNLVVVRAGDNSHHNTWLKDCRHTRNWDIMVSYYEQPTGANTEAYECCVFDQDNKLRPLFEYWKLGWFKSYDYVWLPDPDIITNGYTINSFFEIMSLFDLSLAQPSLSADSFSSHAITKNLPDNILHFTNFVEVMMPGFSKTALDMCAPSFADCEYMWGIDYVWPKLLGYPSNKIAVIDAVIMKHSKPVGATYDTHAAYREMSAILSKYEVSASQETFSELKRP